VTLPTATGTPGAVLGGWPGIWREAATRLLLLTLLAAYVAGPGWSILFSPAIPAPVRFALLALAAIGVAHPVWSPAALIGVVPLLPVLPSLVPAVPPGVVHLVVATQAIPWFARRLLGPRGDGSSMASGWAIVVGVATVSMLVALTPEPWRGPDVQHVARLVRARVPSYIFEADHLLESGALPTWTVFIDGLACALMVGWAATRDTRERTLRAGATAAILTALFGFWQATTGLGLQTAWLVFDAGILRINATYTDPNALAAFYALVGPVLAGLAMRSTGWRRVSWIAGTGLVLLAMVMTAGRAGLAALAAGLFATATVALRAGLDEIDPFPIVRRHFRRVVRATAILLLLALLGLIAIGTLFNVRHEQQTTYLHTWLYTLNLRQPPEAIAKGRIAVWHVAMGLIREHPLVGQGLGAASRDFERMRAQLGIETLPRDAHLSPHNTYLLVTSELGLLGLAAFVLMMAAVVIGVRAPGNLAVRDAATWPVAGIAGGLVGYTLTMLTGDRILLREDVVVGTICAAVATLGAPPLPRAWRLLAALVLLVTVASWPLRSGWIGPQAVMVTPPNEGLHADQIGSRGETYRWSTGDAVLYVPRDARRVRIPIRNLSPRVQRLDVTVDDRPADLRQLQSGPWITLDYHLPPAPGRRWHVIQLQVSPTWQAPGDARVLGVVIGEWEYQ
jgi:O-antigen ligase